MKLRVDKDFYMDDVSIISEGMSIFGDVETHGNIRVDGKVKGKVKAGGNVTVGKNGGIEGNITSKSMTIGGGVVGGVQVEGKLILEAKSQLQGDIVAAVLVIEEGAKFSGKSAMHNE